MHGAKTRTFTLATKLHVKQLVLHLPKDRWLVGYGIDAFGKNTNIGIEWDHDNAYSASNGGSEQQHQSRICTHQRQIWLILTKQKSPQMRAFFCLKIFPALKA